MNPNESKKPTKSEFKELSIYSALVPVFALILMLFYNVFFVFGDDALSGSNQFILILGAAVAAIVGFLKYIKNDFTTQEITAQSRLKI